MALGEPTPIGNESPFPCLGLRRLGLVWLVLTAGVVVAMLFVRMTEDTVSQYQTPTFEGYARDALEAGRYERAIEICTGAIRTSLGRGDHWGMAYLLRARAYAGLGATAEALAELDACARFWTRSYFYATESGRAEAGALGRELGLRLLDAGDARAALRAFSSGAVARGDVGRYLHELAVTLAPAQRAALWPDRPYLVLEDFESPLATPFELHVDEQGRELSASLIDSSVSRTGGSSALLSVSEGPAQGVSWYKLPVYVALTEDPFAIRLVFKQEHPLGCSLALQYWFELARESASTRDGPPRALGDGWECFEVERDFHAERLAEATARGYLPVGGIIHAVGLMVDPGPANRYWVDRIEVYMPETAGTDAGTRAGV